MQATMADVLAPLSVEGFLEHYLPNRPYHRRSGNPEQVAQLKAGGLEDADTFLRNYSARVSLLRPDGFAADVANGSAALPFLKQGFTCYARDVHLWLPHVADLVNEATALLGLPPGSMTAEVFCSTGTSGVAMHSDYDVNFAILLAGHKRWRLSPNTSIVNQTSICLPGHRKQVDETQLHYAHAPFPESMPDDALDLEVLPGGMIFLPSGWWHETQAEGECLQLNLVVKGPTYADLLAENLRDALLERPEWRSLAVGLLTESAKQQELLEMTDTLLKELQEKGSRSLISSSFS